MSPPATSAVLLTCSLVCLQHHWYLELMVLLTELGEGWWVLLDMDSPRMVVVAEADGAVADAGAAEDERSLLEVVDMVLELVRPAHTP